MFKAPERFQAMSKRNFDKSIDKFVRERMDRDPSKETWQAGYE